MNRKIDCILAVPTFEDKNKKHVYSNLEMLGPEYVIASLLYNGYNAKLLNAYSNNIDESTIIDEILTQIPPVVGVTCASQRSFPYVSKFIVTLRNKGYNGTIIVGGFYATLEPNRILNTLNEVDYINLGEGEYSFVELVDAVINSKAVETILGIAYRKDSDIVINSPEKIQNLNFPFFPYRFPIQYNAVSNMIDGKYIPGKYYNNVIFH